jgi:hypothetical protein
MKTKNPHAVLLPLCITNPQNLVFLTRFFREQETTEKTEQDGSKALTRLRSLCLLLFQVWLRPKAALIPLFPPVHFFWFACQSTTLLAPSCRSPLETQARSH